MTSQEIYEKLLKAENEYSVENSKFFESDLYDRDSYAHVMYLMGRMHALNELYVSACLEEEFVHV